MCAVILSGLLYLVFTETDREGFVLLTDETYHAEIIAASRNDFSAPDGLILFRNSILYADEHGSAVRLLDGEESIETLADKQNGILSPEEIAADKAGNIYFTDKAANEIWIIEANGKPKLLAGREQGIVSIEGLAIAPDGGILVGDSVNHQILSIGKNGAVSVFLGADRGIEKPESMTFDDAGNLFIADDRQNILYQLNANGELRRLIEAEEKFSPESIYFYNGALYITDGKHGKLHRFNFSEGLKTIAVFGGKMQNTQGITIDRNGNIYVSIQKQDNTGLLVKLHK